MWCWWIKDTNINIKILNSEENDLDDIWVRYYCKLVETTEKKVKARVERKSKILDKKYKPLINKFRIIVNSLSEDD